MNPMPDTRGFPARIVDPAAFPAHDNNTAAGRLAARKDWLRHAESHYRATWKGCGGALSPAGWGAVHREIEKHGARAIPSRRLKAIAARHAPLGAVGTVDSIQAVLRDLLTLEARREDVAAAERQHKRSE